VQLRRWWPTALIQAGQRLAHRGILRPVLSAQPAGGAPALQQGGLAEVPSEQGHPAAIGADPPTAPPARPVGLNDAGGEAPTSSLPLPLRLLRRFPVLPGIPGRVIAIGPLPEHAPAWARRPEVPVPTTSP
jgi:hypothetical protein